MSTLKKQYLDVSIIDTSSEVLLNIFLVRLLIVVHRMAGKVFEKYEHLFLNHRTLFLVCRLKLFYAKEL